MIMYTSNERVPELRAKAVKMVRSGKTTREVAKYFGYSQSVIVKWCKKVKDKENFERIETLSSRPHNSPNKIDKALEMKIVSVRLDHKRCADIIHKMIVKGGDIVSLPTVKRVIKRNGLVRKRSLWKKKRIYPPRPGILAPGDLIQIDTVHITKVDMKRTYIYTAIDVYSRVAYAKRYEKCNTYNSINFLKYIIKESTFKIKTIQTDNGSEFSKFFTDHANRVKVNHRHIHPRSPNENGHLERFNRTVQEEPYKYGETYWVQKSLDRYMYYYNNQRMHLGIGGKTPNEMLQSDLRLLITRC
jgi:transposase